MISVTVGNYIVKNLWQTHLSCFQKKISIKSQMEKKFNNLF